MQKIIQKAIPYSVGFAKLEERLSNAKIQIDPDSLAYLQGGSFQVLVPEGTSDERSWNFRSGLLLAPNPTFQDQGHLVSMTPDTRLEAGRFLCQKMSAMRYPAIYAHDFDTTSQALESLGYHAVIIDEQTYVLHTAHLDDPEVIGNMLELSNAIWHSLAVVIDEKDVITSGPSLIAKAKIIVMSVYDGESYLVWQQHS